MSPSVGSGFQGRVERRMAPAVASALRFEDWAAGGDNAAGRAIACARPLRSPCRFPKRARIPTMFSLKQVSPPTRSRGSAAPASYDMNRLEPGRIASIRYEAAYTGIDGF